MLKDLTKIPAQVNGSSNHIPATRKSDLNRTPRGIRLTNLNTHSQVIIAAASAIALFGIGLTIGILLRPGRNHSRSCAHRQTTGRKKQSRNGETSGRVSGKIAQDSNTGKSDKNSVVADGHQQQKKLQRVDNRNEPLVVEIPDGNAPHKNRHVQKKSPNKNVHQSPTPQQTPVKKQPTFAQIVENGHAVLVGSGPRDLRGRLSLKSRFGENPDSQRCGSSDPGTCSFSIRGCRKRSQLQQGQLSADVGRDGAGFAVNTPGSKIVDSARNLKVSVTPGGDSRVFVKEGFVEVVPQGRKAADGKWRQYSEQTSIISPSGKKRDWVLSVRFDRNGFGHVEFNGKVLDQFVTHDNASFVLKNICSAVGPKLKAVQPYLKRPIRGAICIDSEFTTFEKPQQLSTAYNRAQKLIKSRKFKQLEIEDFVNARRKFENRFHFILRKIHREADLRNQMPMISVNLNAAGVKGSIQFPRDADHVKTWNVERSSSGSSSRRFNGGTSESSGKGADSQQLEEAGQPTAAPGGSTKTNRCRTGRCV